MNKAEVLKTIHVGRLNDAFKSQIEKQRWRAWMVCGCGIADGISFEKFQRRILWDRSNHCKSFYEGFLAGIRSASEELPVVEK